MLQGAVTIVPNSEFNLCSITEFMDEGWILGADEMAMWFTKEGMTLRFDIVIPTGRRGASLRCNLF